MTDEKQVALVTYGDSPLNTELYAPAGKVVSTPDLDLRPTQPVGRPDEDRKILLGLKLVQKPHIPIDGAVPSNWVYQGTNTMVENPRIVLLDYLKDGQVFWPDYDPSVARPIPFCWSDNGRVPGEKSERRPMSMPQSGPCFVPGNVEGVLPCEHNIWVDGVASDGSKKRVKPECTRQRRFLVAFVAPDGEWYPAVWECHGAAMKFAKEILTAKMDTRSCRAMFVLSSRHKEEPGRDYYVPQMAELLELEEGGRRKAMAVRDEVLAQIEAGQLHVETVDDTFDPYAEQNGAQRPSAPPPPPPPRRDVPPPEEDEIPF